MFDWLVGLFVGLTGIPALASAVRDALTRLVSGFLSLFKGWVVGAINFSENFATYVNRIWIYVWAQVTFAEWLVFTALPRTIGQAFDKAIAWGQQEIAGIRSEILGDLSSLESWALDRIGAIDNTISQWFSAFSDSIGTLWNRFVAVEHRVAALLTNPRALADWLASETLGAIGRYALSQAGTWARWALPRALPLTASAVDMVERIFVNLFM